MLVIRCGCAYHTHSNQGGNNFKCPVVVRQLQGLRRGSENRIGMISVRRQVPHLCPLCAQTPSCPNVGVCWQSPTCYTLHQQHHEACASCGPVDILGWYSNAAFLQIITRSHAAAFFILCCILLFYTKNNSCATYSMSWVGFAPVQVRLCTPVGDVLLAKPYLSHVVLVRESVVHVVWR